MEEINTGWEELFLLVKGMGNREAGDGGLDDPNLCQTPLLCHLLCSPVNYGEETIGVFMSKALATFPWSGKEFDKVKKLKNLKLQFLVECDYFVGSCGLHLNNGKEPHDKGL